MSQLSSKFWNRWYVKTTDQHSALLHTIYCTLPQAVANERWVYRQPTNRQRVRSPISSPPSCRNGQSKTLGICARPCLMAFCHLALCICTPQEVTECDSRVVQQLLNFMYRYTAEVLQDAEVSSLFRAIFAPFTSFSDWNLRNLRQKSSKQPCAAFTPPWALI
jgi:hypothetical protein